MLPQSVKDWRLWSQIFMRRWYIILGCFIVSCAGGLYVALTLPPEYNAVSKIMILNNNLLSGSRIRSLPRTSFGEDLSYFRRIITSDYFLSSLIDSTDIKNEPKIIAKINLLAQKHPEIPFSEISQQVYIEYLRKKVSVRTKSINTIEISAKGKSPEQAFQLCKILTYSGINEAQKNMLKTASAASSFSDQILSVQKKRLSEAEALLEKLNNSNKNIDLKGAQLSKEKVQEIESLILSTKIDIQTKSDKLNELKITLVAMPKNYFAKIDESTAKLKAKILRRSADVCELFRKFGWKDNEIIFLNQEISQLKKSLNNQIESNAIKCCSNFPSKLREKLITYEKLNFDIEVLQQNLTIFRKILDEHEKFAETEPSREAQKSRLEREVNLNRDMYSLLLQQAQGNQIFKSAQEKEAPMRYKILSPPLRPLERVKPNRKKILLIAVFLGMSFAFGIILLFESWNLSFRYVDDVMGYLDVPVIATIPKIPKTNKSRKHVRDESGDNGRQATSVLKV